MSSNDPVAAGSSSKTTPSQGSRVALASHKKTKQRPATDHTYSQNLVSVLNDPSRPRSHVDDFFTRDWGVAFVNASTTDFVLSRTGSKALRKSAASLTKGELIQYLRKWRDRRKMTKQLASRSQDPSVPRNANLNENLPTQINDIFFGEQFDLSSQETFETILALVSLDQTPVIMDDEDDKKERATDANANSTPLKVHLSGPRLKAVEKRLSDNLDLIEDKLAKHVRLRAADFFKVMTSLDTVMADLTNTIRSVTVTRQKSSLMREVLVNPSYKLMTLHVRSENLWRITDKLNLMNTVHQTQPTVQLLLARGDYVGALELIGTSREVNSQELVSVASFRHLASQLNEIENAIQQMMLSDFVKLLASHWNRPISMDLTVILNSYEESSSLTASPSKSTKNKISTLMERIKEEEDDEEGERREDSIINIISGLIKEYNLSHHSSPATANNNSDRQVSQTVWIELFIEEAKAAIRAIIKQTIIQFTSTNCEEMDGDDHQSLPDDNTSQDSHNSGNNTSTEINHKPGNETNGECLGTERKNVFGNPMEIATRIRSFSKWTTLMKSVILTLVVLLKRIERFHLSIYNTTARLLSKSSQETSSPGNQTDSVQLSEITKSLTSIYDMAYKQVATLIEARLDIQRLTVIQFVEFVKCIHLFSECGASLLNGGFGDKRHDLLRVLLVREGNKFVSRFHDERKKKVNMSLDIEQWRSVTQFGSNGPPNGGIEFLPTNVREALDSLDTDLLGASHKPVLTNAVVVLIDSLLEYVACSAQIVFLAPDLATRILHLLRHFNQRTFHLVLNARAVQVAGLKTISARNLMTCRHTVLLAAVFIRQYIKNEFTALFQIRSKSKALQEDETEQGKLYARLLQSFDDMSLELEEHAVKLEDKVVSIVSEIMDLHLGQWEAKPPLPSQSFSAIAQHICRLYLNLQEVLSKDDISRLFCQRIHATVMCDLLRTHLARIGISADGGPQFGTVTQEVMMYIRSINAKTGMGLGWDDHFSHIRTAPKREASSPSSLSSTSSSVKNGEIPN